MKTKFVGLLFLLASFLGVQAQVKVNLEMDQDQFLPSEALLLGIRIQNQSGQPLTFAEDLDWVKLMVETYTGKAITQSTDLPAMEPFTVESSQVATKVIDLAPYFDLTLPGRFRVAVMVKIKPWDKEVASTVKTFEIVKGFKLWDQDFGMPIDKNSPAREPEVRKYTLLKATYLKQFRLYAQISDAISGRAHKVFAINPMVSFSKPEVQIDRECNLHVLCQSGARCYTYSKVTPDGTILLRQIHGIAATRPVLRPDGEGGIRLLGGARQPSPDDLPAPSETIVEPSAEQSTAPPITSAPPKPDPKDKAKKKKR